MLQMGLAGSGAFVDCLQPHLRYQAAHPMTAHDGVFPARIRSNLARPEERVLAEAFVIKTDFGNRSVNRCIFLRNGGTKHDLF